MKTAFLFSGQGAQTVGMMKDIFENSPAAKRFFEKADRILGRSISSLCFDGPQEALNLTLNTQPCVLAADLAAYAAITEAGIRPDAVAGFSLGEYAALNAAGVLKENDVFPLIQKRADFMQEAVPVGEGAMAAVMKLPVEEVKALCNEAEGYVVPANYNCPGQIVVSGETKAVDSLIALAKTRKIRAMKLPVSAPFHCEMMAPAAEKLSFYMDELCFSKPTIPVYMNVDAKVETNQDAIKNKLVAQAKSPVHWEETLRNMANDGVDTFIELGPGTTLSGFVKKTFPENETIRILNVSDQASLERTLNGLGG